jgi:hypothetical protein
MKVRSGFVSNSSSSSFCIYGTCFELDEMLEKVRSVNFLTEDVLNEIAQFEEDGEYYEITEILQSKMNLEFNQDEEQESFWIGKSWSSIGDDETGREFKESVKAELEKMFGPDIDCDTYDEVIYG